MNPRTLLVQTLRRHLDTIERAAAVSPTDPALRRIVAELRTMIEEYSTSDRETPSNTAGADQAP
jgi:hypothetical protein